MPQGPDTSHPPIRELFPNQKIFYSLGHSQKLLRITINYTEWLTGPGQLPFYSLSLSKAERRRHRNLPYTR